MREKKLNELDNFVMQFIAQQRKVLPDTDKQYVNQALYDKFDEIIESVIFKNAPEISLIISCSYQKYSLMIPAKQNSKTKYYLLYDKYLAQHLKMFNAVFLYQKNTEPDLWKFSYQLFSEETYLAKDMLVAFYTAINANALDDFQCKDLLATNENNRWIDIQVDYILAHEVGHWLFRLKQYQKERDSAIIEINEVLEEVYSKYSRKFKDKDYISLLTESIDKIRINGNMLEECFCDSVAYSYIFSRLGDDPPVDKSLDIIKGLLLCLLHTQILSMCNFTVNDEGNYEIVNSIRLSYFRNYIMIFLNSNEYQLLSEMLETTIKEYENKITNIILPIFSTIETRIDNLYDSTEIKEANSIIRSILRGD